jgi:hypothetical protein
LASLSDGAARLLIAVRRRRLRHRPPRQQPMTIDVSGERRRMPLLGKEALAAIRAKD